MPKPFLSARVLGALLAVHASALCSIAGLLALVLAGGASGVDVMVPVAFCFALVAGAALVYVGVHRLQRRGRNTSAAVLTGAYVVIPPVALCGFLY